MKKRWIIPIIFASLIVTIFLIRLVNQVQLDDLTPGIPCEKKLIEKADVLWVIPDFENNSIYENKTWCNEIISMNKTIGMHGIHHSYREFGKNITKDEVQNGMEIFKSCFGFYPTMFKPPQLAISNEEKKVIKDAEMELLLWGNQLTHKVYHCNDSDRVKNWMIDIF